MGCDVVLPRQTDGDAICSILKWYREVGDKVKQGDLLCLVEREKATFEVESPADGIVAEIFVPQGREVAFLARIARLE